MLDPATHYRILKLLEQNPAASQRELARAAGVSLGKLNYCLKALIAKGLVKAENFRRNPNKLGYLYVLTPQGIAERARLTVEFLRIKEREVEELRAEIEAMRQKVGAEATSSGGGPAVGGGVAFASGAGTALQFKGSYES